MKRLLFFCALILLFGSVLPCTAATSQVDLYRKALTADPQNQTLRYHLGVALLNQGEDRQALSAFRRVYSQRADDPEINFNLALVYSRLEDPDSALIYLDQARASGAGNQPEIYPLQNVYFNLVLLYEQSGQLGDAVSLLQRLSSENPSHLEYLRVLGDYQLRLGRIDEAIGTLGRYLQKMPEDTEVREYAFAALFNRGLAAYEKRKIAVARSEFSRALQFVDKSPLVFYYLAVLDYQEEKYLQVAGRLPLIFAALGDDLKSSARSILYNTALSLKRQGDYEGAQRALLPLSSAVRPRAKDLALLAGIQLQLGENSQARQNYLRVLREDPGHVAAVNGIQAAEKGAFNEIMDAAGSAFATEKLTAVRGYLEQAAEIYPEDNRLRIYQARLSRATRQGWLKFQRQAEQFEEQQRYADALAVLRKGLRLAPQESRLLRQEARLVKHLSARIEELYRQGRDLYTRGELHSARARLDQLVALSPTHQGGKDYLLRIDQQLQREAQQFVDAGEFALERANLLEARRAFTRALRAWPGEAAAIEGLKRTEQMLASRVAETLVQARRARSEGRLSAARKLLSAGQQKWPADALDRELAEIESELSRRQKSIALLARAAIRKQQFVQATQLLAQVRRLSPESGIPAVIGAELKAARSRALTEQLALARQEVAAGNVDAGLKAYRRALDIEPGNTEALAGLKQGRDALAATISRLLAEGSAAHKTGRLDQAQQAYRNILSLDPHHADALTALRQIERAGRAGLTSADSKRLYLQGIELYTEGDYKQAIAVWYQVLDLAPDHAKARMNIDKATRKLRQIRERQGG